MAQFWQHHPLHVTVAFILLSASEIYVNFTSFMKDSEDANILRLVLVPSCLTCLTVVIYRCYGQAFDQMQQELEESTKAKTQLISMLCETCVSIAPDGETLTESSPHFNNMVGKKDVVGASLKSYIWGGKDEEARLADAFVRARCVPVALPVTLVSSKEVTHQVHLFIVRWRMSVQSDFRFLVGIQIERSSDESSSDGWNNGVESPRLADDITGLDVDALLSAEVSVQPQGRTRCDSADAGASIASSSIARHSAPPEFTPERAHQQSAILPARQRSAPPKLTGARGRQAGADSPAMRKQSLAISRAQELRGLNKVSADLAILSAAPVGAGLLAKQDGEDHEAIDKISLFSGSTPPSTEWCFPTLMEQQLGHANKFTPLQISAPIFIPASSATLAADTDTLRPAFTHYHKGPNEKSALGSECGSEPRRAVSAPPSIFRSEGQQESVVMIDLCSASSEDGAKSWHDQASVVSSAPSAASAEMSGMDRVTLVKVGHSMPGEAVSQSDSRTCLSTILKMKANGKPTVGSCHEPHGQCVPCSFHFSHVRFPETRAPCRASFVCEYCHDETHFPKWRSSLRKLRKPPGGKAKESSKACVPAISPLLPQPSSVLDACPSPLYAHPSLTYPPVSLLPFSSLLPTASPFYPADGMGYQ